MALVDPAWIRRREQVGGDNGSASTISIKWNEIHFSVAGSSGGVTVAGVS